MRKGRELSRTTAAAAGVALLAIGALTVGIVRTTHAHAAPQAPAAPSAAQTSRLQVPSAELVPNPPPRTRAVLPIRAGAAILVDVDSAKVLWSRDAATPRAPASLTKLVTAMVAADLTPLDRSVTVTADTDAAAMHRIEPAGTVMGLKAGEVLTVRELLYGLFLRSGNDAAETLAGGLVSRTTFMSLMNSKAAEMGMTSSHFTTPVGLDDPAMKSSPADLAKVAAAIVTRYPALLAISGTVEYDSPATPTHAAFQLRNYNKLVLPGPGSYAGATGMKTAFTDDAGPCMVATAVRGRQRLVAVVMHSPDMFQDARLLLDYGFAGARPTLDPPA
jgi:D-alanyl-D-alanine carboxypeptidase/D-alanyl-D-alanine carboxypeptidase (penicillin-binding protein 5/6)